MTTIGFIGAGNMGRPMITNLCAAGHEVKAYDASDAALDSIAGVEGCSAQGNAQDVANGAEFVLTALPNDVIVREVVTGGAPGARLIDRMVPDSVLIDLSSSAPWATLGLAEEIQGTGVHFADAPVSGGVTRAKSGTLAVFVGADEALLTRVRPILTSIGHQVFHAGPLGSGHAMKALNNLLSAACLTATVEVLAMARAYGIDPETFTDIVNASSGSNNTTQNKLRQFILSETYGAGFPIALMVKDIGIAHELGARYGASQQLCDKVVELWGEALDTLGPDADHTAFAKTVGGPATAT